VRYYPARRYGNNVARYKAQTIVCAKFGAFVKKHLKTHADTEQGFTRQGKVFDYRAERAKGVYRETEGGDTRQDQGRSSLNLPAVATQLDRATQVVKGIADAFDISNVIINNNKHIFNQTPA
jgi:hypothetical protein